MTENPDPQRTMQARADAVVQVARLLPAVRQVRIGTDEPVNPYMPEDDAALLRTVAALVDRGDTCASALGRIIEAWNVLARQWDQAGGKLTYEQMDAFSDALNVNGPTYEWQKSRERMAWAAEHRSMEAFNA